MFRILSAPLVRHFCSQVYKVRVSNLNFVATEEQVEDHFKKIGQVKEVKLIRHLSGNSKGAFLMQAMDT